MVTVSNVPTHDDDQPEHECVDVKSMTLDKLLWGTGRTLVQLSQAPSFAREQLTPTVRFMARVSALRLLAYLDNEMEAAQYIHERGCNYMAADLAHDDAMKARQVERLDAFLLSKRLQ